MSRTNGPGARLFEAHDVLVAVAMSTRLPVPVNHARASARIAAAAWAAPLVGVVVGAAGAVICALLVFLGAPPTFAAWAAIAVQMILTGALHEDGLADCADGLGAGGAPTRIREIMRDSRIGAFGAAALVVSLSARAAAIGAIATLGTASLLFATLIASAAVSRAFMVALWAAAPAPVDAEGLAARAGRPAMAQAAVALALGAGATGWILVSVGGALALGALCAFALAAGLVFYGLRRIGSVTGDLLGAGQCLAELALLAAVAAAV